MEVKMLKWINLGMFLIMVSVNFLAELLPIGYGKTSVISSEYSSLFTPAGYAFSIWGVIYAFMLVFVIWQWVFPTREGITDSLVAKLGFWFAVSCLMNTAWIFAWHYRKIGLSVLFILGLLVSLIFIQRVFSSELCSKLLCRGVRIGFDIYLGWIIAATIANISAFLVSISWNRFGLSEGFWTCVILIVGAVIGALPAFISGRIFTTLAVTWAYFGILIKFLTNKELSAQHPAVVVFVSVSIVLLLVSACFRFLSPRTELLVGETVEETVQGVDYVPEP